MRPISQLLALLLFLGCGNGQSQRQLAESSEEDSVAVMQDLPIRKFVPDSSYLEYWCSIEVLKKTSDALEKLSLSDVGKFLATFHQGCDTNVEYLEWSSELLFEVVQRSPEYLIELLDKNNSLDKAL
ncbi:MAG: hypothetical protein AAGA31_18190, partial [Bacteroidota bacterium]